MVGGGWRSFPHRRSVCTQLSRASSSKTSTKRGVGKAWHSPSDRSCEVCQRTKTTRALYKITYRQPTTSSVKSDLITADHIVLDEDCESRYDQVRSDCARFSHSMVTGLTVQKKDFSGNGQESSQFFFDQIASSKANSKTIGWNLATPVKIFSGFIVHQRLAVLRQIGGTERAVRRVQEGTSATLLQSGLVTKKWTEFVGCTCYLRNAQTSPRWENTLMSGVFEAIQWANNSLRSRLNIIRFLPKNCQKNRSYRALSLDFIVWRKCLERRYLGHGH